MIPCPTPPPFFIFYNNSYSNHFLASVKQALNSAAVASDWVLKPLTCAPPLQGCSSPLVVKFADTQRDKEQRRLQQQLVQQIQQLNNASTWGNLASLGTLTPQYLAVSLPPPAQRGGSRRMNSHQRRFLDLA